jgi:hypothetical protein
MPHYRPPRDDEPSATMKAVHLYIGVFIGCTVIVGTAISVDRRITESTSEVRQLQTAFTALTATMTNVAQQGQDNRETNIRQDYEIRQLQPPSRRNGPISDEWRSIYPPASK